MAVSYGAEYCKFGDAFRFGGISDRGNGGGAEDERPDVVTGATQINWLLCPCGNVFSGGDDEKKHRAPNLVAERADVVRPRPLLVLVFPELRLDNDRDARLPLSLLEDDYQIDGALGRDDLGNVGFANADA